MQHTCQQCIELHKQKKDYEERKNELEKERKTLAEEANGLREEGISYKVVLNLQISYPSVTIIKSMLDRLRSQEFSNARRSMYKDYKKTSIAISKYYIEKH